MTTYQWNTADGDWTADGNWDIGGYPNAATADAVLGGAGTYDVTIDSAASITVGHVTLSDAHATLTEAGALTLTGTSAALSLTAGTLVLGGLLADGTVDVAGGTLAIKNGATLSDVALVGSVAIGDAAVTFDIVGGLLDGTSAVAPAATISVSGSNDIFSLTNETIEGVAIDLGPTQRSLTFATMMVNGTVTLGPKTLLTIKTGGVVLGDTLVNEGTIDITAYYAPFGVASLTNTGSVVFGGNYSIFTFTTASFVNSGQVTIEASDTLVLQAAAATFLNSGTVTLANGADLLIEAPVDITQFDAIHALPNANITLDSTLDLLAGTVDLSAGSGEIKADGGTFKNGTIVESGYSLGVGQQVTLDGMTLLGGLNTDQPLQNFNVDVRNGLTVETVDGQSGTISLTNPTATFDVLDSESWNNLDIDFNSPGYQPQVSIAIGHALTLGNDVTISVTSGGGGFFTGGRLVNQGQVDVTGADLGASITTASNSGTIVLKDGGSFSIGTTILNSSPAPSFENTGVVTAIQGGYLSVGMDFVNAGLIEAQSGLFSVQGLNATQGTIGGGGTLQIDDSATLEIFAGSSNSIKFVGVDATLDLYTPGATYGTFSGLSAGDVLLLQGDTATSASSVGTDLAVTLTGGTTLHYTLAAPLTGLSEPVIANGGGIEIACFRPGTRIATPSGVAPVETLRAGDPVRLADGRVMPVRWVGRQTVSRMFADPLQVLPVRIPAGALGAGLPTRDLMVSPGHALLLDGLLVHAGALVGLRGIARDRDVPERFAYLHVELNDHALLLAEGVAAESYCAAAETIAFDNLTDRPDGCAVAEMPFPRVRAARQLPVDLVSRLGGHAAA